MHTNTVLNLLIIDDDQLYAERLVKLLSAYYDKVNLGFLDEKEELVRALSQQWDVLLFGMAYDLVFTDVVDIIQEQNMDLPIICLMNNDTADTDRNNDGLPAILDSTMIKAVMADQEEPVIMAIVLQHDNLRTRRQLKELHHLLLEAEQRANILIKNSKSAMAYMDQGIHIFANDAYLKLFGFESMDEIIGIPVIDLIASADNAQAFKQFLQRFDKGERADVEFDFESQRRDNSLFEAKLQLAMATLNAEPVTQIIIQQNDDNTTDIAQRLAQAEGKDSLTNLSNRHGFEERFERLYRQVLQDHYKAGLLYVQLDNFGKIINSLGLQGGDTTIQKVAGRLQQIVLDGHISRFNDNAFTVLVEHTSEKSLEELAETIRASISEMLIEVGQRTTSTTASIGVVMIDKNAPEPKVLIERALEAISHIRMDTANQGDAYHFYDPRKHANIDDNALAETLLNAIANNRFDLFFQPIYDITSDRSDFFEVYLSLSLTDSESTVLTPDQFMGVAQDYKLLEKIDRWVLVNACKQVNELRKTHPQARILVQLTSASLVDKKLTTVASQLIEAIGGADGALTVQFNEQDVVNHLTIAQSQFAKLSQLGCQVAINNFGTSTKSLDLADLVQPNMTRLAKSYIKSLDNNDNLEVIKSLVAQTNALNVDVLMPYIEDAAMMSVAWSVGARYLQGYYLEEPSKSMKLV